MTESWVQNNVEHIIVYLYDESGAPIGMQYRTSNYAWGEFDNFYFEKNLFGDVVAIYNESGTSQTGAIHYYCSCISSRRKRAKCTIKKSVKKQYLEDLVLQAVWNILSDAGIVCMIAETIVKLHEKECRENATLKALEAKRNTATKASKNLITANEQGIITKQTKIRLKELETEISEFSIAIEQEKLHSYTYLTVPMIEEFLRSATIGDIQDTNVRKHIVNTFIREVIYYPDKIIITLNFTDNYDKPELTSEHIADIEKQSESETAFSLPQSSNKFTSFPR